MVEGRTISYLLWRPRNKAKPLEEMSVGSEKKISKVKKSSNSTTNPVLFIRAHHTSTAHMAYSPAHKHEQASQTIASDAPNKDAGVTHEQYDKQAEQNCSRRRQEVRLRRQ